MGNMWPMVKGFARDFARHRSTLGLHNAWISKHAMNKGWSVNSRWMAYTSLRLWLADCQEMYGQRYCPCFEPSGEAQLDEMLLCPCEFAEAEIEETGWCHCTLFGRSDLSSADYRRAETYFLGEYRDVPLRWRNGMLDTRGMPLDKTRGLPIPDTIHQVKRALNSGSTPLSVLVSTRVASEHVVRLAELRGLRAETAETTEGFKVALSRV